jgi:fructose-1,6-bisphosphatase II / sedoheptulose-1,7-bisphosphatase
MKNSVLTPSLADSMVRVTESAAIAAAKLVGRGDAKKADDAAVDACARRLTKSISRGAS